MSSASIRAPPHAKAAAATGLKPEALCVKVGGSHIGEVTRLSIADAARWFAALDDMLTPKQREIARRILKEINERLQFLVDVGLEYLTLSRTAGTLSGGESQRIRLASQIGSGLTGVLYVLDEPSIGLHQRDNARLLGTLRNLRDLGNTVLVVEHDEDAIMSADYVVDMGPGAGVHGGEIVAEGEPAAIVASADSLTGRYLSGAEAIPIPAITRPGKEGQRVTVRGARANNLASIDVTFRLGTFTCVTGVSGSGKSTLVVDTLYRAAARRMFAARVQPGAHDDIDGLEFLDKVVDIDQSPIGRTPRSNPATFTCAFGPIREWYAGLPEAKARGYKPGRYSFNVKGGRCEACQGDGLIKIEMHFLPDIYVQCEECRGRRYNRETLQILYRGQSIADVLAMTVDDGTAFFKAVPAIRNKLETLQRVGLGYIQVGQQATTLSGGEAQRVKLAKELSRRATGRTLYILDEPTTGLHFHDVRKLLEVLHALVESGNTVVVIEHNLEVIKTADLDRPISARKAAMAAGGWSPTARPTRLPPWPKATRASSCAERSAPRPPSRRNAAGARPGARWLEAGRKRGERRSGRTHPHHRRRPRRLRGGVADRAARHCRSSSGRCARCAPPKRTSRTGSRSWSAPTRSAPTMPSATPWASCTRSCGARTRSSWPPPTATRCRPVRRWPWTARASPTRCSRQSRTSRPSSCGAPKCPACRMRPTASPSSPPDRLPRRRSARRSWMRPARATSPSSTRSRRSSIATASISRPPGSSPAMTRRGPGGDRAAYINCPLDRDRYDAFIDALLAADTIPFRDWERDTPYFEGCLPIEVMAARGRDTLRFGPMKPVGLTDPATGARAHAVVQLRQDNALGTLFNMVGFQTKLSHGAQKQVFRLIPGLEQAQFARLGGIHRNTFINSPVLLDCRAAAAPRAARALRRPDHRR